MRCGADTPFGYGLWTREPRLFVASALMRPRERAAAGVLRSTLKLIYLSDLINGYGAVAQLGERLNGIRPKGVTGNRQGPTGPKKIAGFSFSLLGLVGPCCQQFSDKTRTIDTAHAVGGDRRAARYKRRRRLGDLPKKSRFATIATDRVQVGRPPLRFAIRPKNRPYSSRLHRGHGERGATAAFAAGISRPSSTTTTR